jgi:hypothetical protein
VGLGLLDWWDCGFEPRQGAWVSLSLVSVVCCQVDMSETVRSLVQRSPSERGVSEWSRNLDNEEAKAHWDCRAMEKNYCSLLTATLRL